MLSEELNKSIAYSEQRSVESVGRESGPAVETIGRGFCPQRANFWADRQRDAAEKFGQCPHVHGRSPH